ncbi:hypothetical protein JYT82_00550, partial [bacterium AH-315-K20]|nr:hypothetical protein [bacterium AH-315-K20]
LIDGESTATTVNEASRVGGSIDMSHAHLPYVADHGRVTVLDPIPGADLHRVLDVGEDGTVIGLVRTAGFRAAIWRDGEACLLEDLLVGAEGWTLEQASDMNIAGQIAAIGVINGEHRAVLLTPVPMPTPRREQ